MTEEKPDYQTLEQHVKDIQAVGKLGIIDIGQGSITIEFGPHQDAAKLLQRIREYCDNFDQHIISVYKKPE